MDGKSDRAPIIAPPPLLGLACIGVGFVARHFKPLRLFAHTGALQIAIGVILVVSGIAIIASARSIFIAHGTHPNPYRPTKAIVSTGVYQWSRNPIYIAFMLIVLAFTFLANSLWFAFLEGLLFLLLHFGVVKREETYLLAKFGESYAEYCRRVRRWI